MEMASTCAPAAERPLAHPIRGPHGGWQKHEIDALVSSIDAAAKSGESLRSVFDRMGQELGRRPNSIRNFYYAQVRAQSDPGAGRALPFETFSSGEVEQLVRSVLTARAQGMSVRACVRQLADGDRTKMLRYQNKYRSTIRTRPDLVKRIMDELSRDGVPFVSPYAAQEDGHTLYAALQERANDAGDPQLTQLFESLGYLMDRALGRKQEQTPAQDSDAQRKADRLSVRCDMLRIALDDEQTRMSRLKGETENMVSLIKEYIALPQEARLAGCEDFCRMAAGRLSAVECALMNPTD